MDKLANLKRLHDSGALSDDDYAAKKAELLSGDVEQVHHTGNDEPDERSQSGWGHRAKAIGAILAILIVVFAGTWWFLSSDPSGRDSSGNDDAVGAAERAIASAEATLNELADSSASSAATGPVETNQEAPAGGVSALNAAPEPQLITQSWLVGWWERGGDGSCPGDSAEEFISDGTWSAWGEGGEWRLDESELVLSVTRSKEGYTDTGKPLPKSVTTRGPVEKTGPDSFTLKAVGGSPVNFKKCSETDE